MKIIKLISDNTVIFADINLSLDETGAYKEGWKAKFINSSNAVLVDVSNLPDNFINGGFTYIDGIWTPTEIGNAHIADIAARQAEQYRLNELESTVKNDTIIAQLKVMDNAEYSAWFDANVTNATQAIQLLKRLTRVIIRRVL